MLKHGILGLLNYGPMTGYEINEAFDKSLGFFWQAQKSQIYRELGALEERGWICRRTIAQEGKPDKNLCELTDSGRDELVSWLRDADLGPDMRSGTLMHTFFMGDLPREENIPAFRRLLEQCEHNLAGLQVVDSIIDQVERELDSPERALYWRMTIDFGRRYVRMNADWARDCIRKLEEER